MRFDKERFFEDLQEKIPEVYGNDKVQELIKLVIDKHYKKVENDEIVYDDDLLLELYDMVPEMSFNIRQQEKILFFVFNMISH